MKVRAIGCSDMGFELSKELISFCFAFDGAQKEKFGFFFRKRNLEFKKEFNEILLTKELNRSMKYQYDSEYDTTIVKLFSTFFERQEDRAIEKRAGKGGVCFLNLLIFNSPLNGFDNPGVLLFQSTVFSERKYLFNPPLYVGDEMIKIIISVIFGLVEKNKARIIRYGNSILRFEWFNNLIKVYYLRPSDISLEFQ